MTLPNSRVNAHVIRPMPQPISTKVLSSFDGITQTEHREVRGHLLVAGEHELLEREAVAGLVVEHPAGFLHHLVGGALLFGDATGGPPGNELHATTHVVDCASSRRH